MLTAAVKAQLFLRIIRCHGTDRSKYLPAPYLAQFTGLQLVLLQECQGLGCRLVEHIGGQTLGERMAHSRQTPDEIAHNRPDNHQCGQHHSQHVLLDAMDHPVGEAPGPPIEAFQLLHQVVLAGFKLAGKGGEGKVPRSAAETRRHL